ncbi:MAG TPA: cytochrome c peroxidase, partial [Polyangiaceae bacterium]|nr:cytochrome c peroxidase [Polyangiaceae bacterium]
MNARRAEAVGCGLLLLAACGSENDGSDSQVAISESLQSSAPVLNKEGPLASAGRRLFDKPFAHTNGRSCATCHVASNHFALLPADVQARLSANPSDPLFNAIDADDPTAATPTYEHLKLGLVRITLKLPDNMDLINADGSEVVTPPDRTFSVWRGVPTVENTFYTAPYQYDGRFPTFQIQAQGAITAHSQGPQEPEALLDLLAGFESTVYSSDRARSVALQVALGVPTDKLKNPEDSDTSNGN